MFGFPVGVLGVRFSQELDEITLARSRKLYSYKHQNLIAKKRLIKLHKRLRDFRAELLNLRDLYDQLADATSDMIHLVDQGFYFNYLIVLFYLLILIIRISKI